MRKLYILGMILGMYAKNAPHGTDEEDHHRQNCQHGQHTT